MELLTERYADKIVGVLSCFDRVVIQGIVPGWCYAQGMTSYLYKHHIRVFDYPRFAQPLRDALRTNAEQLADQHGVEIEFIRKKTCRKEDRIQEILRRRGDYPGLVHIIAAMETCPTYKPWHNKNSGKTYLRPTQSKCLHYYFYFIDPQFGLCYMRVPTWCPFRLQFYFNGHNYLASDLRKRGVPFRLRDNCFLDIGDFSQAQQIADNIVACTLHQTLDTYARMFCPVVFQHERGYHWSLMQAELATDIIFKSREGLKPIYDSLVRTAIHCVKADDVATFLGKKLTGNYQGDVGNNFSTRIEGTRIRHVMGPTAVKMYDKFSLVLRIETSTNDVSFFPHYREVEHRDGSREKKWAHMKKTVYSINALAESLCTCNRRYLEFISTFHDPSDGVKNLDKLSRPVAEGSRSYRGFNAFDAEDLAVLEAIGRGEHTVRGFTNRILRRFLPGKNSGQVSRILKRLRLHGLIKRIGKSYRYYLTRFGCTVLAAAMKIKNMILIPDLAKRELQLADYFLP